MKGTMLILDPIKVEQVKIDFDGPPPLEAYQKAVGGYIELVPQFDSYDDGGVLRSPCVAFCNEEGKLKGLPFNEHATLAWDAAYKRIGMSLFGEGGKPLDVLCGPIAVLYGDAEFMEAL